MLGKVPSKCYQWLELTGQESLSPGEPPMDGAAADTKEQLQGNYGKASAHLFCVGASPASCARLEYRLASVVGGQRDEEGRMGRLGWRLGWGWGKGSAPWLGAC